MTSNAEAAELFLSIADLLDLMGEKFKPEAYRRAARSIESMTEDLKAVAARGELETIPGVGKAIAEKIESYLQTGSIPYYEKLTKEIPAGLIELMRLPGLGPKTTRRFWTELGVEGPAELRDAIAAGRLDGVKGFGPKKIEQIRSALEPEKAGSAGLRRPIEEVFPTARALVAALRDGAPTERVEVAGSFRRFREMVGDLDILVTSQQPEKVFDVFSGLPQVAEIVMRGGTKETVLLKGGFQVDVRVVEPGEFGAAFVYFTGSKDHNIHLRSIARDRGLKVNEYGVYRGEHSIAGKTEEDVYASLGLAWIPPELREDHGEIEFAAQGKIPALVQEGDLRGDLHVHLPPEAKPTDLEQLTHAARDRHYSFLALVVAGVDGAGSTWTLSKATRARAGELSDSSLRVLSAVEFPTARPPAALEGLPHEVRILRPTTSAPEPPTTNATGRTEFPTLLAHVGSTVAADSASVARWVDSAHRLSAALEVGPGPERLDSIGGRAAGSAGVPVHLPTSLGAPGTDPTREVALGFARRAGLSPERLVNTGKWEPLSTVLSGRKRTLPPGSNGPPRSSSVKRRSA